MFDRWIEKRRQNSKISSSVPQSGLSDELPTRAFAGSKLNNNLDSQAEGIELDDQGSDVSQTQAGYSTESKVTPAKDQLPATMDKLSDEENKQYSKTGFTPLAQKDIPSIKEECEPPNSLERNQHKQQQPNIQKFTKSLEESAAEIALDTFSKLSTSAKDRLAPIAMSGINHLNVFKEEGADLKRLLSADEIIIYKTDAIAIMLRKYGRVIEFFDAYDALIREGYVLDHSEAIESFFEIPINGIKTRLGKLYYFHHRRYTTMTPPPNPTKIGADKKGPLMRDVANVFLKGSGSANVSEGNHNS